MYIEGYQLFKFRNISKKNHFVMELTILNTIKTMRSRCLPDLRNRNEKLAEQGQISPDLQHQLRAIDQKSDDTVPLRDFNSRFSVSPTGS